LVVVTAAYACSVNNTHVSCLKKSWGARKPAVEWKIPIWSILATWGEKLKGGKIPPKVIPLIDYKFEE
jgi:hypothetical protein